MELRIPNDELRPLVAAIIGELWEETERLREASGKLCFSESEAATMLGMNRNSLRDERRRGRIKASQICGRRIRYLRSDLLEYLGRQRINC